MDPALQSGLSADHSSQKSVSSPPDPQSMCRDRDVILHSVALNTPLIHLIAHTTRWLDIGLTQPTSCEVGWVNPMSSQRVVRMSFTWTRSISSPGTQNTG